MDIWLLGGPRAHPFKWPLISGYIPLKFTILEDGGAQLIWFSPIA